MAHAPARFRHLHPTIIMSAQIPSTMQAIVVEGKGQASIKEVPTPKPTDGQVLVKIHDVAVNPTDWKHLDFFGKANTILGSDFAGTIVAKAPDANTSLEIGTRVFSMTHGGFYEGVGAYAQYLAVHPNGLCPLPKELSDETAAGLGIGTYTAIFGLFQKEHLALPKLDPNTKTLPPVDESKKILVWSGASNVGQYVIQLARALGMYVIATASPRNHEWLKSLGASATYNYSDNGVAELIGKEHPGICYAFDAYSENNSATQCLTAMDHSKPGRYLSVLNPGPEEHKANPNVQMSFVLLYTLDGRELDLFGLKRSKEQCMQDVRYFGELNAEEYVPKLIMNGILKPAPLHLLKGGLSAVHEGLDLVRTGKNSGKKVVIPL
ncbi:hypothetical protein MVES1_003434 [Malassezia vespertilionis]|uniref:Enoyl reductase (ER) domain-containing protein n=1 Tax=Malassezia vespertilionis TaxID=2020962 RepID=A0A2N1J7D3_9BASI|nr:uncharacterized protein MVES1_003434 [Malassezia vespertilionis]PKI82466.1 hypothetical protein MVES_003671 [Malassezia vespertilionis]WFD08065.1 hypothetical protein MVES1_003434 [Malassezia vespertilionis]